MQAREALGFAVVAAASMAAGWGLHGVAADAGRPTAKAPAVQRAQAPVASLASPISPSSGVRLFPDGSVSVHVERGSVPALIDDLLRAGVRLPAPSVPVPASAVVRPPAAAAAADGDPAALARTLREGGDADREQALLRAQQLGLPLDTALLRDAYQGDPSERVRLLAFAGYLDAIAADGGDALRGALQTALYDHSAALQTDARRRLGELEQLEQAIAATPPQ
ncbi:MAG TPA: hypothetical protein VLI72_16500 [Methylibium sp.]|nr:hypothetical protein [Methylibium sp.]